MNGSNDSKTRNYQQGKSRQPGISLAQIFGKDVELVFQWTSFLIIFMGDKLAIWWLMKYNTENCCFYYYRRLDGKDDFYRFLFLYKRVSEWVFTSIVHSLCWETGSGCCTVRLLENVIRAPVSSIKSLIVKDTSPQCPQDCKYCNI